MITSTRNPKIQRIKALQSRAKKRREEGYFVVEGVRLGEEALEAGWQPLRVEYFNAGGGRGLDVSWRGPRQARAPIPAAALGRL